MRSLLPAVVAACVVPAVALAARSTLMGELHVQTFHSATFGDEQTLRVWLPPGYHDPANAQHACAVLVMLDGQNLFDAATASFGTEWQVDETVTRLVGQGAIEPVVVVGIDSPGKRRADEYLPYPDVAFSPEALEPHGRLFPDFLASEVLPLVRRGYRITADPAHTGVGGSSYGAIAALYALLRRPDVFGLGLIESPSLQAGNGQLLRDAAPPLLRGPRRVYVGIGLNEGAGHEADLAAAGFDVAAFSGAFAALAGQLGEELKAAQWNHPAVKFVAQPGGQHQERYWAERFPAAVTFLFPPAAPP